MNRTKRSFAKEEGGSGSSSGKSWDRRLGKKGLQDIPGLEQKLTKGGDEKKDAFRTAAGEDHNKKGEC